MDKFFQWLSCFNAVLGILLLIRGGYLVWAVLLTLVCAWAMYKARKERRECQELQQENIELNRQIELFQGLKQMPGTYAVEDAKSFLQQCIECSYRHCRNDVWCALILMVLKVRTV